MFQALKARATSIAWRARRSDPITAPIVERIFTEFIAGAGDGRIAESLARDGLPSPSAYDPGRNSHRSGKGWAKSAVRAILINPRYTGYEVRNKQRKDEVLIDVNDVALGHTTKMRWNERDAWMWSGEPVHPAIVSVDDFETAQRLRSERGRGKPNQVLRRSTHPYALRGLVWCGACN